MAYEGRSPRRVEEIMENEKVVQIGGSKPKWTPEANQKVIEMGKRGLALAQMAAEFEVSRKTLFNWTKNTNCKGFKDAMGIARTQCEAFWVDAGMRARSSATRR